MPAHANEAPSNSIANAAAGAEQSSRLNIHPLPVLLGSLAEASPKALLFEQFARTYRADAEATERRTHVPKSTKSTIDFRASSQA
jgi:hypothetical protein